MLISGDLIALVAVIMGTSLVGLRMILAYRYGPRKRFRHGEESNQLGESISALREEIQTQRDEFEADRLEMHERIDFIERALIEVRNRPQVTEGKKTPV